MAFFFSNAKIKQKNERKEKITSDLAYQEGCKVCSLKNQDLRTPKMEPSGNDKPLIYILGEAPGADEDINGYQFCGKAGKLLRKVLNTCLDGIKIEDVVRFNNIVNCRPPDNRTPTSDEITCCKKRIEEDIIKSKPLAIFGFGNVPLSLFKNLSGIVKLRGRRFPIKIGNYTTWYFPMLHPSFISRKQGKGERNQYDLIFEQDIKDAINFLNNDYEPPIVIEEGYKDNITCHKIVSDRDLEKLDNYINHIIKNNLITALDIETTGINSREKDSKILTIAISSDNITVSIPFDHPNQLGYCKRFKEVKEIIRKYLINSNIKVCHNLKFELKWLRKYYGDDVIWNSKWSDTMYRAYLIDERIPSKQDNVRHLKLDYLCYFYFGFYLKDLNSLDITNLVNENLDDVLMYNAMDSKYTLKLYQEQEKQLTDNLRELDVFYSNITRSISLTEENGLLVDTNILDEMKIKFEKEINKVENKIKKLPEYKKFEDTFGREFKPTSDKDLPLMFEKILGIKCIKQTEKGNYATDNAVLTEMIEKDVELAKLIEELREKNKILSTYILPTYNFIDKENMMRPDYFICGTVTGRFCIAKDTKIEVIRDISKYPEGISIQDVKIGDYAYTFDKDRKLTIKKVLWSGKTGFKKIIRIYWKSQGKGKKGFLDVTPEHEIRLINGSYVPASTLKKNDRVMALTRKVDFWGYSRLYPSCNNEVQKEHRFIYSILNNYKLNKRDCVHHIDGNKINNNINNFEIMSKNKHASYYGLIREMTIEEKIERSLIAKERWKTGVFKVKRGKEVHNYINLSKFSCLRILAKSKGTLTKITKYSRDTIALKCKQNNIDYRLVKIRYDKYGNYISKNRLVKLVEKNSLLHVEKILGVGRVVLNDLIKFYKIDRPRKWANQFGEFIPHNHIIEKIEYLDKYEDVYDLEIEDTNNFIANQICVHNSATAPPIQTYPKDNTRQFIIPPKDHYFVAFDYGQLEARVIAMYSNDEYFKKLIFEDYDVHKDWAIRIATRYPKSAGIKGIKELEDKKLKEFRQIVKNAWVFPLFYLSSAEARAKQLMIPDKVALDLYKEFWVDFKGVKKWQNDLVEFYHENGYVEGLTGRRRRGPLTNFQITNNLIQGTGSDIVNDSMTRLSKISYEKKDKAFQAIMNIHDDLPFYLPRNKIDYYIEEIVREMVRPIYDFINVPLSVEVSLGNDWWNLKPFETFDSRDFGYMK